MTFILTSDQEVPVAIAFADDHGNAATVDAAPVWAASDVTILSVVAAADGMSAVVAAVGPDGQAQVSVSATSGGAPIVGTLDVQVVSGSAVAATFAPGTPVSNVVPPAPAPSP
jgi:hypothetical protein